MWLYNPPAEKRSLPEILGKLRGFLHGFDANQQSGVLHSEARQGGLSEPFSFLCRIN